MMPCAPVCFRELISQDPAISPGVVASNESILRAFFPSDRNKTGVKRSAIPAKHLWNGQVSVWRLGDLVGIDLPGLVDLLEPMMVRKTGEKFDQIRAAPVSAIREYEVKEERGFSVLDECDLDDRGNKHPAHAHIAICERLKAKITFDDEVFVALQEWLKLLFEGQIPVWQRAAA